MQGPTLHNICSMPSSEHTLLVVNAADLKQFAMAIALEARMAFEEQTRPVYMTRDEVMALLHISNGTLYNYVNSGKLTPVYVGDKKLFIRSEVDHAVRSGQLRKYSHDK